MAVVALYTDFPAQDFYAGLLKARLVSLIPHIQIIDVVHGLPLSDANRAGVILENVWSAFPVGTIHLMALTRLEGAYAHVAFAHEGQFFVGTDIGQFSLGLQQAVKSAKDVSHLPGGEGTFPALDLFPKLVQLMVGGANPNSWDVPEVALVDTMFPQPSEKKNEDGSLQIRGHILYIDGYGNVITNISRDYFNYWGEKRRFSIHLRYRKHTLNRISQRYSDEAEGNVVAVFNAQQFLEIGFVGGSLVQYFGLQVQDNVTVEFLP